MAAIGTTVATAILPPAERPLELFEALALEVASAAAFDDVDDEVLDAGGGAWGVDDVTAVVDVIMIVAGPALPPGLEGDCVTTEVIKASVDEGGAELDGTKTEEDGGTKDDDGACDEKTDADEKTEDEKGGLLTGTNRFGSASSSPQERCHIPDELDMLMKGSKM